MISEEERLLDMRFFSYWVPLFHRTSRLGPAAEPTVKAVHTEGRAGTAFPPRQTKADTVSASSSGDWNSSYRYLFFFLDRNVLSIFERKEDTLVEKYTRDMNKQENMVVLHPQKDVGPDCQSPTINAVVILQDL